jgi:polyisoprenoid-binding protein YceI
MFPRLRKGIGMARQGVGFCGVVALAAICFSAGARASPREYAIDPAQTVVSFEVRKLGISRQSGEFNSVAGTVALDAESGGGSMNIAVDTRSIRAGSAMAEKFLRGPSVLNVEQYNEIAYRAAHVVYVKGKPGRIDGELTLLGVTRPVSLTIVDYSCPDAPGREQRCKLDATAVFRRSDFGMTGYMAIISDEVKLEIHGVAGQVAG